MALIGPLASLVGIEADALMQRVRESAIVYAAIALFSAICVVFLLVTLYAALLPLVGPIWSPLIIAAGALVIALILFIALRVDMAARKRRQMERRREAEANSLITGAAIAAIPELLRSPVVRNIGLPLAIYAGALLLAPPRKRRPRN